MRWHGKGICWWVYGPPLYGSTRVAVWAPYVALSIDLSPAVGASCRLDRRGCILWAGLLIAGVTLEFTFPKKWQREIFWKRKLLW